jgi:Restriction endonuclease
MANKSSRDLEILVAKIQRELAPDAQITHNAKIKGRVTGRSRQIDVLVRKKVGQYDMTIIIDCKDHARPVDVKGVEEFHGLVDDVGANKGALVCPTGFTETAKKRAAGFMIDLYSPIDTDPHKWQVKASVPALMDFREAAMSFKFSSDAPVPFMLPEDFLTSVIVVDNEKNELGAIMETALKKWDEGRFPIEPGEHNDLDIFEVGSTLMDNGYGQLFEATLTVSLWVTQKQFFGEMPVSKVSGFKDEQTGLVFTNAFTVGLVSPEEVVNTWREIKKDEDLPIEPVLKISGLVGYQRN